MFYAEPLTLISLIFLTGLTEEFLNLEIFFMRKKYKDVNSMYHHHPITGLRTDHLTLFDLWMFVCMALKEN